MPVWRCLNYFWTKVAVMTNGDSLWLRLIVQYVIVSAQYLLLKIKVFSIRDFSLLLLKRGVKCCWQHHNSILLSHAGLQNERSGYEASFGMYIYLQSIKRLSYIIFCIALNDQSCDISAHRKYLLTMFWCPCPVFRLHVSAVKINFSEFRFSCEDITPLHHAVRTFY